MTDSWGPDLPDGWTWSTKEVAQWEWRCPFGDLCGKNNRLLYKKKTADDALIAGTWHLFDKQQHSDPPYNWQEAVQAANEGLTEGTKEVNIVLDDKGEEVHPPSKTWWDYGNKGKSKCNSKAKSKGFSKGGGGWSWGSKGGDAGKDRSRSPPSLPALLPQGSTSSSDMTLSVGGNVSLSSDVAISKIELEHTIDCIKRTVGTCQHCQVFVKGAMDVYENSAAALKECKHTLERLRRK